MMLLAPAPLTNKQLAQLRADANGSRQLSWPVGVNYLGR